MKFLLSFFLAISLSASAQMMQGAGPQGGGSSGGTLSSLTVSGATSLNTLNVTGATTLAGLSSGSIQSSANISVTSAGEFFYSGRSVISSPADSIVRLTNNAETDFNRLQLGGTTSSFPSIKRNGTGIDFRLADDSAYAPIASGTLTIGSGTAVKNIRHGISGAMTGGVVTVTDTGCTANTRYFFTTHALGTIAIPAAYYASTRTASTSFVITSSAPTDTSTVDWMAVEP